jgi:hypothetical protein
MLAPEMWKHLVIAGLVAVSTVTAASGGARAGQSDDLMKQGLAERRKSHDREALDLFKRAYELDHSARAMAQIGLAEQALGSWADAETHIDAALAHRDDPWIRKNESVLRRSKDAVAAHLGSLELWGTPEGAEVVVNGSSAGTLPLASALRVPVGTVAVTVRADGYVEASRVLDITAGTMARERFALARKSAPTVTLVGAAGRDGTAGGRDQPQLDLTARSTEPQEETQPHPVWKRWWFWTAVGTVVAAGAVTAFLVTRPKGGCPASEMCTSIGP